MDNSAEVIEKPNDTAPLHHQILGHAVDSIQKSGSEHSRTVAANIKANWGIEDKLLRVLCKPDVKGILFGSGRSMSEGVFGKLLEGGRLSADAKVVIYACLESMVQNSNAQEGARTIKHLATSLVDLPAGEARQRFRNMGKAAAFFDNLGGITGTEKSRPSDALALRMRGAFGEAFTMLALKRIFTNYDVNFSDTNLDMLGIDIQLNSKDKPDLTSACSVKSRSGIGQAGGASMNWYDSKGVRRGTNLALKKMPVGDTAIFWGGLILEYGNGGVSQRVLGQEVATKFGDTESNAYLAEAARSFFNKNDPRLEMEANPKFNSQILFLVDFSNAVKKYGIVDLAPQVCQSMKPAAKQPELVTAVAA